MCPQLMAAEAQPEADARAFEALCERLMRYSPIVSIHALGEAFIDITGCQRLFGGEENILADVLARLAGAGFEARAGLADAAGGAWAVARYGGGIVPHGQLRTALAPLPVEALRLDAPIAERLKRFGLKRVGQLYDLPRAPLTARFTGQLLTRLGQALGEEPEPLTPLHPAPKFYADLKLPEPIASADAVIECLKRLAEDLCAKLEKAGEGGRRFELTLFRGDNDVARLAVGTSRPARAPAHILRLFETRLDDLGGDIDAGFGFEQLRLSAGETARIPASQQAAFERDAADEALAEFKDRLSNRLGGARVCRARFRSSHLPERAAGLAPVMKPREEAVAAAPPAPRPIKLLPRPEEIEALAEVPDGPPARFIWRRVSYAVVRASGPERIADEWFRRKEPRPTRDYYRIEDETGRRYWVFREGLYGREGVAPRWFLHGFFA